ncbi:DUF3305 domain-containing protein [Vibrio sp. ZSDE26]|uniref:DUF3305 domain-containing protein n=1 Tax=Vibrio amylolyticus TaxID=2847292 RepID=A0A9X2BIF9_9VIBR|nr:DUF3305 domain-containing protein [Vibrio amylolyticus]MCK6264981.1 DUF3305 domain-containing protein [Vibrio amylolyticus]
MSNNLNDEMEMTKSENAWPIRCHLTSHEINTGIWSTIQWQLTGFDLTPDKSDVGNKENSINPTAILELFKDERTDYRFNLNAVKPKLFLVLDNVDETTEQSVVALTASQSVAGQYMDGDYLVLSNDMPLPVQAWMEAYIGRHGELIEQRRKKRKGAGRASGN